MEIYFLILENHVAAVQFSFDVDYNSVIRDSETKKEFLKVVEEELATTMKVDTSMILNITISPGSIIVNFILLAPEQSKFYQF
jgi:predicted peptidase